MNTNTFSASAISSRKTGRLLAVGLTALLLALPGFSGEQRGGGGGGGGAMRAPAAPRATVVDRSSHGSVRHVDTYVVQRPTVVRPVEARPEPEPVHAEPARPVDVHPGVEPRRDVVVNRDLDAEVHRAHGWDNFAYGRHWGALPVGYLNLQIGGVPYYYCDGIYYQPGDGGYQEVYPPVGAELPEPPDGAIEIDAGGGQIYYYAGGAFYAEQPDGSYAIVPTPIGVVVPELPPGAVQVSVNGTLAYQFNGVYYEPVFVDGVTQYQTFTP